MEEKLDYNQLENLIFELSRHKVPSDMVLNMLNINSLAELSIKQYNYLLYILKN